MSGGDVCYAGGTNICAAMGGSKAASGFGEGADAPLVLFDAANASEVLVLSAFDKFGQQRSQASGKEWLGWGPDLSLAPAAHALPAGYNSSACLFGGSGGINHVVNHDAGFAFYVTDQVHHLCFVSFRATFVDDSEIGIIQFFCDSTCTYYTANVWRNNN